MHHYPRLRDLREDFDLSQTQLAEKIGTSQKQYSRWETGERQIPTDKIIMLAKIYNVSSDYILGLTDEPTPPKISSHKTVTIHQKGKNNISKFSL